MTARHSLLVELDNAIERGSGKQRAEILRNVTDLFLGSAERYNDEQVNLFDDVIIRLIEQIETKALVELGRRLAPVTNAPEQVMRRLARHDAIAVAGPVLARSPRVREADLVDIAESKSQAHLLAISGRHPLGKAVTDVLVRRGNPYVKRNVAANNGASFSESGYGALVAGAEDDETLAERIIQRADVPPHLLCTLLMQATEEVRNRLIAVARPEMHAEIRSVLDKVSGEIAESIAPPRDYAAVIRRLLLEHPGGSLGEHDLVEFAASKRFEETVAALALLTSMPAGMIEKLMAGDRIEPILILCKAAGFEWPTVRVVILVRPGGRANSPEVLTEACDDFNSLSSASAQEVLRFWQSRDQKSVVGDVSSRSDH